MGERIVLISKELLAILIKGGGMPAISNAPPDLKVLHVDRPRMQFSDRIGLVCESKEWKDSADWPAYFDPVFSSSQEVGHPLQPKR